MSSSQIQIQVISSGPQLPDWANSMLLDMLAIEKTMWAGWTRVASAAPALGLGARIYKPSISD
jgi:hypothetical protein